MEDIILKMSNIKKEFHGVYALKGVSLTLRRGEVHALLGENGAGKSTLMKCLAGIYPVNSGTIELDGKVLELKSPTDSINNGISVIHQELALAEELTVAANIFMGQELVGKSGFLDSRLMEKRSAEILQSIGADFSIKTRVFSLSTAQKQMLEIAKALSKNVKILVMDEPTAAVSHKEVESIFKLIETLKSRGITIVYISHRMDEIFRIADRVTVLRDGANVDTVNVGEISHDQLVKMMVGYDLEQYYTKKEKKLGEVILSAENITRKDGKVSNADIFLRKGEIIGIAGLVGSGRTEMMEVLYGLYSQYEGMVKIRGQKEHFNSPAEALEKGICLVPEDRKTEGLFLDNTVRFNLGIGIIDRFIGLSKGGVDTEFEKNIADKYIHSLAIKTNSQLQKVISLSGGNQQKIVLGKWLAAEKEIMILDEPTRGVDVGAKAEIYSVMEELTSQGCSIIMVSSELPEVINMSDRIYVMREGHIVKHFDDRTTFDQEEILNYMLGLI